MPREVQASEFQVDQEPCGKTTGYEKRKSLNCIPNAALPAPLCQLSKILLLLVHLVPTGQDATIVALQQDYRETSSCSERCHKVWRGGFA